jgi:hypothetical protein
MKYAQFCYRLDACTALAFMNCCEKLQYTARCRQCPSQKRAARSRFRSPSTRNQTPINQTGHIDENQMKTLIQKSSYRNLLADVNLDGKVDLGDIALTAKMFGKHLP